LIGSEANVQAPGRQSAEEFFGGLLSSSLILHRASVEHAANGHLVPAVACELGSDLAALESVVWERLNILPSAPQRQYFRMAGKVVAGLQDPQTWPAADDESAAAFIAAMRESMLGALDPALASDVTERWPDVAHLASLPAPSQRDFQEAVNERLEGRSPGQFIDAKRAAARTSMAESRSLRVRGDIAGAVHSAYASDSVALEAYLVQSAALAGDTALLTVIARWELATYAIAQLSILPDGFLAATTLIRETLAAGIGDADGERLLATLLPV
jgi:hypothetical protein